MTDRLSVKCPSLCSTGGTIPPSRPAHPGALRRAAVKDGRRPPFFTARSVLEGRSLRSVFGDASNAKLWKGEDRGCLLSVRNGYLRPKATANNDTYN